MCTSASLFIEEAKAFLVVVVPERTFPQTCERLDEMRSRR
jgi:hypothetical protein